MYLHRLNSKKHCRWCSNTYYARQPWGRDGFCKKACKQALYRARKRAVTANASMLPDREMAQRPNRKRRNA